MMSPDDFIQLLRGLTLPDNVARNQAEQTFTKLQTDLPDICLRYLVEVVKTETIEKHIKQLAIVLLRKALVSQEESYIHKITQESKQIILQSLQVALVNIQDESLRMKIAEIAGELVGGILDVKEWPELHQLTAELCNTFPRAEDKIVGLTLLGFIAESQILQNPHFLRDAATILQNSFQYFVGQGHGSVVTVTALDYILQSIQQPSHIEPLFGLVPHLFNSFGQLIQATLDAAGESSSHQHINSVLEHIIDIADHSIIFLQGHLELFVPPIFQYIQHETRLSASFKYQLVELLVIVCTKASKKVKKMTGAKGKKQYFLTEMLKITVNYMENVPDEPRWEQLDSVEELESNSLSTFDVGESAFRRCIHGLGVVHTYKKLSTLLTKSFTEGTSTLASQPDAWKKVYNALTMVAGYVEITLNIEDPHQLALHRHEVLSTLVQFIQFPQHGALPSVVVARIRFAAFSALSSYLLYHGSALKDEDIHRLLPMLLSLLSIEINPAPRVRRSILIALIHLMESVSNASLLTQYSTQILSAICQALQQDNHGSTIVQESCITALVSFTELTKSTSASGGDQEVLSSALWRDIYANIMPLLKSLLQNYQRRNLESLWAQTLECITLMGEAVGPEVFYNDAKDLLAFLSSMQESVVAHSDVDIALLKAMVRVARCLGAEFLPHLHNTVTRIFAALTQDIVVSDQEMEARRARQGRNHDGDDDDDVDLLGGDDDEGGDDEDDENNGVQMLETLEGHLVAVRSALIEEQTQALHMLGLLLADARQQAAFYPYLQQTLQFLQQALLKSPHEDIRGQTLALLPKLVGVPHQHHLLNVASNGDNSHATESLAAQRQILVFTLGMMLPYLEKETNVELVMAGLATLKALLLYTSAISSTTSLSSSSALMALSEEQMTAVVQAVKMIMRDSLQRRAMLRAELQLNQKEDMGRPAVGGRKANCGSVFRTAPADDDDEDNDDNDDYDQEHEADEYHALFQETIELHYHLAEVLNALFQTHRHGFTSVYLVSGCHDMVVSLSHGYCFVEDRRLAFLVLCDVLEFGLQGQQQSVTSLAGAPIDETALVTQVLQIMGEAAHEAAQQLPSTITSLLSPGSHGKKGSNGSIDGGNNGVDSEVLRCAVYGLGVVHRRALYERFQGPGVQQIVASARAQCLQVLQSVIGSLLPALAQLSSSEASHGSSTGLQFTTENTGACLDNAVRSLGIVLHSSLSQPVEDGSGRDSLVPLLVRYLAYLPMRHDTEEGEHALADLVDMLTLPQMQTQTQPQGLLAVNIFYESISGDPSASSTNGGELLVCALLPLIKAIHHATTLSLTPETQHRIAHLLFALLQSTQRVSDDWHLTPRLVAALSGAASSNASAVDEDYAGTLARVLQSVASTV